MGKDIILSWKSMENYSYIVVPNKVIDDRDISNS